MEIKVVKTYWFKGELKQNTYIVEQNDYCIIIDAGCPLIEVQKLTTKPIKAVFVTHCHYDHINFVNEYDALNVPIYVSKNSIEFLSDANKNMSYLFNDTKNYVVKNLHFVLDGEQVKVNSTTVTCYETPGHTNDSMSYLIENNLFSGDTVFSVAVGRTDLPTSSTEKLVESLKRVEKINYTNLFAGHGRQSSKQEQVENIAKWLNELKNRI